MVENKPKALVSQTIASAASRCRRSSSCATGTAHDRLVERVSALDNGGGVHWAILGVMYHQLAPGTSPPDQDLPYQKAKAAGLRLKIVTPASGDGATG